MAGLFHSPKTPKMPAPPDPVPLPYDDELQEASEFEKRRALRRKGRRKTIVTGELEPAQTKKIKLG